MVSRISRVNLCVVIVTVVALLVLCGSAPAFSGAGWGTESAPHIITNVQQLQQMSDDLGACYALGNDVDASDTRNWNGGAGFEPIGSDTEPFTGRFDGRRHRVTQLYINRPSTDGVGLFGYIKDGAVVKNVGLAEVDITARRNSGPLVGSSSGSMVCYSWSTGSIRGSHDYQMRLGGLIGISCGANSHVYQCFSSVNVTATGGAHQVGGLAGYNGHGSIMTDCYATGNVSGTWKVGGLVGDNLYPEGGFVKRCYSIGKVSGRGGGLVGFNWRGGITEDSYWDTQTSGKTSSYGGTGKTTREMLQQSTFENWDFDETWDIKEGESYPFLILKRREIRRPQIMTEGAGPKLTEAMRGLVAYWKFDEGSGNTAYDSAGNNNGTIHGAKWTKGTVGGALSFDGKDNYVMIPDSDVFDFGKGDFSISTWFKTVSMSDQFIIGFRGSTKCIEMYVNSASHVGSYIDTGSETIRLPFINTKYNDGKWHHAAITLDNGVGNGYRLFLDGIMVGALTCSADFSDWSHIAIGGNPKGTWNKHFFNGQIDEIAIYNQALSAEKVQQLYQSQAAIYQEPSASSGLIAHWRFDEGSGSMAHDSAGGHRGIVRGAAWSIRQASQRAGIMS